ncbi:NAD(P)H-dependent glycerol-3-phosphate dehydrogenase [Jannaschia sp. S6380]|uniref:NAD(P)H-dependent glycerol-3-phosphate dehydrogenase n=1 Tax=Jannaschia sp. S6380 TaxID=2926408 RepID=UPI001FF237C0|nr:NAD(P)H-dependent glycerol-3-phosphate dehydrogenase [Jannaschia sp. S6380]MCK0169021.1 NAD(P)H-dependent glycerol-3-phosphate dehydrogenase [Jannaschia sp. S6380]
MIGVCGAGAFGAALSIALARSGAEIRLWGRDAKGMAAARQSRRLPRLPEAPLPDGVIATGDIDDLRVCDTILVALPMQTIAIVLPGLRLGPAHIVAACKGLDLATLNGATAILRDAVPGAIPAILSGPSFADDIARGLPTALSLGCADDGVGRSLQTALSTPVLRLYRTTDVTGVELGGALKNVVAIACGAAIGAGLGESARAALMTRGMAEIMRFAEAAGARRATLMGLSGLGDLALTCASPASRNFALGYALGRGDPPANTTTEGVATATAVLRLARDRGLDMPVTQATDDLVAGRATVKDAMRTLLDRDLRTE